MDERTNRSFIHWQVSRGDLVKIATTQYAYSATDIQYLYGIVIGDVKTDQITLFPEVEVFLFKLNTTKSFTAGSIEIISHAKERSIY